MSGPDAAALAPAVAEIVAEIAEAEIMSRFGRLRQDAIFEKGPGDLVTEADRAAETRLSAALCDLLPGSVAVGEEGTAADPGTIDRLADGAPVWVIDPLDGTANFVAGQPRFCTLVALVERGRTLAGWIHDPNAGRTAHVRRDEGAWVDGVPLAEARDTAPAEALSTAEGRLTLARKPPDYAAGLRRLEGELGRYAGPASCAGLDYFDVALGRCGLLIFRNVYPWDHAAGALLVAAGGGITRALDGADYTPMLRHGPLMAAATPALWTAAQALIAGTV